MHEATVKNQNASPSKQAKNQTQSKLPQQPQLRQKHQRQQPQKKRTLYIDGENAGGHEFFADYSRLNNFQGDLILILGAAQNKISTELAMWFLEKSTSRKMLQIKVAGRNSLDMFMAMEIGRAIGDDSSPMEAIILSRDTDFDSLAQNSKALKGKNCRISRKSSIDEVLGVAPKALH